MPKILIVDDDEKVREAFARQLEFSGYEAEAARNGKEAVERVQKESFDLILMDLVMPEMDGFEAIRRIRGIDFLLYVPIIVISALEKPEDIEKALELGANDYVTKPVVPTAFKARVRAALRLKESVEKLRTSEEKYKTLLQALPDIVYKLDQEERFVYLSDSIQGLGYELDELLGKHFSEIIHPDDVRKVSKSFVLREHIGKTAGAEKHPKLFDERRSYSRATRNLEVRLMRKGLKPVEKEPADIHALVTIAYGEVSVGGMVDPHSQNAFNTVGIIRDITERKKMEELLRESNDNLERKVEQRTSELKCTMDALAKVQEEKEKAQRQFLHAQKMDAIGRLAAGVAHDFNNKLATIQLYAELALGKTGNSDPMHGDLENIRRVTKNAEDLPRRLLLFSRKEAMELKPLEIGKTINNMLMMLGRLIGENITLEIENTSGLLTVLADAGRMEQVILNLVINARDAMPGGGKLAIKINKRPGSEVPCSECKDSAALEAGEYVSISFQDSGIGMDSDTIYKVFEPFFTTKGPGKGTGLGLSVAYGIIKEHNGFICAESVLGQGSTFTIYLPVVSKKSVEAVDGGAPKTGAREDSGLRILLVEDEKELLTIAACVLRENGYSVEEAPDAEKALEIFDLKQEAFDLVCTDVSMPGMNGIELAERLRSRRPGLPVLLCTGYADSRSKRIVEESGLKCMAKPYKTAALLQAIQDAAGGCKGLVTSDE